MFLWDIKCTQKGKNRLCGSSPELFCKKKLILFLIKSFMFSFLFIIHAQFSMKNVKQIPFIVTCHLATCKKIIFSTLMKT